MNLLNVETGDVIHDLQGHKNGVSSVVFSPNGKTVVSGGEQYKEMKINRPQPDRVIDERQSLDNIKKIVLAQLRYGDQHKTLAPFYPTGPDGRALLSWRVHILPFLGEPGSPQQEKFKQLYDEFDLAARWNSERNDFEPRFAGDFHYK